MRYILGTNFDVIVRRDLAYYCTHCHNPLYDSRAPQHILSCGHKICPRCLESAAQTNKIHYSVENDSAIVPCDICTNIYHSPNNPYLGNKSVYLYRYNFTKMRMSDQTHNSIELHISECGERAFQIRCSAR